MWGLRSPTLPLTYPTDRTKRKNKKECNNMGKLHLSFEEALIQRLDIIGDLLERIALALEEKSEDND